MSEHTVRKPNGWTIVTSDDGVVEHDTLQCVHCGKHWVVEPGSGRERGFCMRCHGVTCGAKPCCICLPYEVRIEIEEGSRSSTVLPYLDAYAEVKALNGRGG